MARLLSKIAWPLMIAGTTSTLKAATPPAGFTATELSQIYSTEYLDLKDGNVLPISREPITQVYTYQTAPNHLKNQWGKFQFLSHSKGYVHLGEEPTPQRWEDLYSLLTDATNYLGVKNYDGTYLFEKLEPIDSQGNRIPSFPTPPRNAQSASFYARAQVKLEGMKLSVDVQFDVHTTSDGFLLQLFNFKPVRYGLLGQVIASEGLIVQLEFFQYEKGWLVESFTMLDLSNFLARMVDPNEVGTYGAAIMELLTEEVVYPIPQSIATTFASEKTL